MKAMKVAKKGQEKQEPDPEGGGHQVVPQAQQQAYRKYTSIV